MNGTHVLVTKDGYEEYMSINTWNNTKAAADGGREGYYLVASTPPEVVEMMQIKSIKSKSEVAKEVLAPELVEAPKVEVPVDALAAELEAVTGKKAKKK